MAIKKERTTPQPHKIVKEMSLFLGKFEPQKDNAGWAFRKELSDGDGYIEVASRQKVNAHDGKIFDFVMSSLFARRRHLFQGKDKLSSTSKKTLDEAYGEVEIDLSEVLGFQGKTQHTKNKRAIIQSLENLVGMTIKMVKGKKSLVYSVLTSVKIDDINSNIVYVKVNEELNQAFAMAGMRFINVERSLALRSDIAVEFTKFIQVRGRGIIRNEPITVSSFTHDDAVFFLHLEHLSEADQLITLRRAIKAAYNQGYQKYQMTRTSRGIVWDKVCEEEADLRDRQIAIWDRKNR